MNKKLVRTSPISKKRSTWNDSAGKHASTASDFVVTEAFMFERRFEHIKRILDTVFTWRFPADKVLSRYFKEHSNLGVRDRATIAEIVYDIVRHLRWYRYLAELGSGPQLRRLFLLGWQSIFGLEALKDKIEPEQFKWLEHVASLQQQSSVPAEVRWSMPDWLHAQLQLLPDYVALYQALNVSAPFDLRVNPMVAERDAIFPAVQKITRHPVEKTPYSPYGIRILGRVDLNKNKLFTDGKLEVQDEGSQLLACLVAPKRGQMIIDFCAGAGGKTLLLGAMMRSTGRIYALDTSEKRLHNMKPRLARSGLSNITPVLIQSENDARVKRWTKKAHAVLVDAPCSGTGTLRRNPDLKWRHQPEAITELCALQQKILRAAARCVMPGGRLVYATCSVLPQENEQQVQTFLAEHPEFSLLSAEEVLRSRIGEVASNCVRQEYLVLRPDQHQTDGFFAAVLERRKEE